jgi:hypothetical protein
MSTMSTKSIKTPVIMVNGKIRKEAPKTWRRKITAGHVTNYVT